LITNLDNEVKFYVVDDASANRSYQYAADGTPRGSSILSTSNAAPRGVASTVAGNKTWVIDANRSVYVYGNTGNLLGTWTAGTLANNATPEGIATNGTDVWIVDSKSDKVYRYAGAASRISGTQTAASSFSLNSGNSDPTDIVTDGASLWVVDDAAKTDKVFKYSVAGSLAGSWTIDSANKAPTGITIDPANVSQIWIVDSGTDRVYQYNAAATRTSGSQSAALTFALAAGNANPQGIADPPAPEMAMVTSPATTVTVRYVGGALAKSFADWPDVKRSSAVSRCSRETSPTTSSGSSPSTGAELLMAREQYFETFDLRRHYMPDKWASRSTHGQVDESNHGNYTKKHDATFDEVVDGILVEVI
jgi:hypothetical protein